MNRKQQMSETVHSRPIDGDELVTEAESWLSAFVDGEATLADRSLPAGAGVVSRLYAYQLIRSSMRGQALTADVRETVVWHERRCVQLWSKIDQHSQDD